MDRAIKMLLAIPPTSAQYYAARAELAELYLVYHSDRHKFMMCHEELVKTNPTPQAYVLLGEACMRISETEKAIAAYENALRLNPGDGALVSRIGKVLVETYEYTKAVDYYLSAVKKDPSRSDLRHELAELYLEIKKFEPVCQLVAPKFARKAPSSTLYVEPPQALEEISHLVWKEEPAETTLEECELQVKALKLQGRVLKEQVWLRSA